MGKSHIRQYLNTAHMEQEEFSEHLLDQWIRVFGDRATLAEVRLCALLMRLEWEKGDVCVGDVAEASGLPRSTTNRLLYNLYQEGLIEYEDHPTDRRRKLVRHQEWFVLKALEAAEAIRAKYGLVFKDGRRKRKG